MGSGKLVLLNGSVSSKNCTLHINVAMMYPCKANLDDQNSGRDTKAFDRRAAPRAANHRQVFCSRKILHPLLSLDLLHSLHAAQMTQDSVNSSPKVKIQGTSLRGTVTQYGVEMSGVAVSTGIADSLVLGQTANGTATLSAWSVRAMRNRLPPPAQTLSRGHSSQTSAGRESSYYRRKSGLQWSI